MTVDERFDRIDTSLSELRDYLLGFRKEVIARLDAIDRRLDRIDNTVASIDMRMPALTKAIADLQRPAA